MANLNCKSHVCTRTYSSYLLRSALILLICTLFIGPLRKASPLIMVEGIPFYVAYLPVSLFIATMRVFGIRFIPVLLIGVYLVFRTELHLNQFQTMALAISIVLPLGLSLILLQKHQGRRYRAAAVSSKGTLLRLCYLGLLYPVLMQLSLYIVGMITSIPDDFQYYFSVKEIILLLQNMQSLILPAVVFTPIFYHLIRMLASTGYVKKFARIHVVKFFRGPDQANSLMWLSLLTSLFTLYTCTQGSAVLSSYVIPVVFLVFVYGFINLDLSVVSLLWGITIYMIIRYDSGFINLIQKDRLLICFSSLFMVFTIANLWLSSMRDRITHLLNKLYASSRHDQLTRIPNILALSDQLKSENPEMCLCYLKLLSVEKIEKHLGFTFKANAKRTLYSQLKRLLGKDALIYSSPNSDLLVLLPHKGITRKLSWIHVQLSNISVLSSNLIFELSCGYSWTQTEMITNLEGTICGLEYLATQGGEGNISALHDNNKLVEQYTTLDINKFDDIRQAIRNNGIRLYVQKIAGVKNSGDYWEVLCRLDHNGRLMTPDIFLPVITEFDLTSYFDLKVFETLLQMRGSCPQGTYSVNIMPGTLGDEQTADKILSLFRSYQVDPRSFVIEITEEQLFFNEETTVKNIRRLREAGFKIAIDDFGRGYANFERLKILEADILKIDGMFIRNMISNETDAAIVQSITKIAKLKGMEVVAEYVESQQHAELLVGMDIDYLQGYHIGKPYPLQ